MPNLRAPQPKVRPLNRLGGMLAAAAAYVNGTAIYFCVPILGATSLSVRFKGTGAGALDIVFVGPDFAPDQTAVFTSLVGTKYTTGNPTQVAVTANTEAIITATPHGENYALVKFTPSADGVVTYCDAGTVPASL